jgi:hypothetical protein
MAAGTPSPRLFRYSLRIAVVDRDVALEEPKSPVFTSAPQRPSTVSCVASVPPLVSACTQGTQIVFVVTSGHTTPGRISIQFFLLVSVETTRNLGISHFVCHRVSGRGIKEEFEFRMKSPECRLVWVTTAYRRVARRSAR